jgi:aldehyde:ferredoxin oxidoreductase
MTLPGYAGRLLRVDLSTGALQCQPLDEALLKKWVGGVGLGAQILYDEVPPGVEWSDPENRLIWTSGPLAGSGVCGAATFNVVTKGPMTNLAGSSQANGFFGAYLKFSGFDGIVLQGAAPHLVYLWIHRGRAEIRDGRHLAGKDAFVVEETIRNELGLTGGDVSIFGIGPAGENGVLFSAIVGDGGHVAAHNGVGAVMGSKNLKAVVVHRGDMGASLDIVDADGLKRKNNELWEFARGYGPFHEWGTGGGLSAIYGQGMLPVKNYTTNIYPEHERMNGQYLRSHFQLEPKPCYRCRLGHVKQVTVAEGPYTGFVGEEPEYEQMAAWGPQIGNTDLGAVVMLAREVDRLGMDCNEASWCVGWAMECYERGVLTEEETGGLNLSWGNADGAKELLRRIAAREGYLGDLLAEGVMRASKKMGGEAADWAVYGGKGATPRGHDHRARWPELFDTCLSNTSTLECTSGGYKAHMVDVVPAGDPFSHDELPLIHARMNGIWLFQDCLGICRLSTYHPKMVLACMNAVTGWNWSLEDAFTVGKRIVNLLRVFNFRHGMRTQDERPSVRYGSVPVDGPAKGKDIMTRWPGMVREYYQLMGWDGETGKPLPETLELLGLHGLIEDL